MNRATAPSEALLEHYLLGELDPARMEEIRSLEANDASLRVRIESLRTSNTEILAMYPTEGMAEGIRARHAAQWPAGAAPKSITPKRIADATSAIKVFSESVQRIFPNSAFRFASLVFALLALGLFLTVRTAWKRDLSERGQDYTQVALAEPPIDGRSDLSEVIRLKGAESGLAIFRKTRAGSELLPPRSTARPGDTLQVFYHSRKALYGIVFSVDGTGSLTLHYPEADPLAAVLQIGDMLALPHSFRLDHAPRFERFFLVTSPKPFRSDSLLTRLRGQPPLGSAPADTLTDLEPDFRQYPYTIYKSAAGARRIRKESGK
jgi:hypothetical protein